MREQKKISASGAAQLSLLILQLTNYSIVVIKIIWLKGPSRGKEKLPSRGGGEGGGGEGGGGEGGGGRGRGEGGGGEGGGLSQTKNKKQ